MIAASGLDHSVNALGTTVEGPADEVWATARAAFDACLESGADSNMMYLKIYQGERTVDELQASGRAAASESVGANANNAISAAEKNAADLRYEQRTKVIHAGSRELPPLIEVPGGDLPLQAVVKPPDADTLWQWEENRGNVDADASWASVWPAAANLAHLLAKEAALVKGRRVVELGAGLGIAGLTAAKTGAKSVTLIDREPLALHCAMSTAVCGRRRGRCENSSFFKGRRRLWWYRLGVGRRLGQARRAGAGCRRRAGVGGPVRSERGRAVGKEHRVAPSEWRHAAAGRPGGRARRERTGGGGQGARGVGRDGERDAIGTAAGGRRLVRGARGRRERAGRGGV